MGGTSNCPKGDTLTEIVPSLPPGTAEHGLISIIVPVFNGSATLQRCVDSITGQTYQRWELIVVDGGSTDGTLDVIRSNAAHIAHWVSERDQGIYDAFNKGILLSRGEWLLFLGCDDRLWTPDVLAQTAVRVDTVYPPTRVAYGQVAVLDSKDALREIRGGDWHSYQRLPIQRWTFEHQGVFHHRSLFEVHGLYDIRFRLCGDQELLLRELKSSDAVFLQGLIVSAFRWGGASSQPHNLRLLIAERRQSLAVNGLPHGPVVAHSTWVKMLAFELIRRILGLTNAEWLADAWARRASRRKTPH